MGKKYAMFIGRWQPFHNGHAFLVQQKLAQGVPVCIAIRDTPISEGDPYPAQYRKQMIEHAYEGQDVTTIIIPDIEGVYIGRQVGYNVERFDAPENIEGISATKIRNMMAESNDDWVDFVPARVAKFLKSTPLQYYNGEYSPLQ